ncbi:RES family NAD+ phosphorylase [Thalassolituus oleivorans]|uniref:RES family NAD+ phosphorylase n=1 Tax=Thalassolituus oleivorans TaxID=187493 RepID=UPI0023F09B49|nr:RES family NAD+ phosphorylase [Thalassolituus oleivorans]
MIWQRCHGAQQIKLVEGVLYRLVESQEEIATNGYVDTLEEQAVLEDLLDQAKPAYGDLNHQGNLDDYHYLLKTPFRYPPLPWGSRFGRRHELGILYGGRGIEVTLAESAFYRFIFWFSIDAEPIKASIKSQHQLFSVEYNSQSGVQLHAPEFSAEQSLLTHVTNYHACQNLGSAMREAGVEAFEYTSARDPERGICVGLFNLAPLATKEPKSKANWFCEVSARRVAFRESESSDVIAFAVDDFLVDGEFPRPA